MWPLSTVAGIVANSAAWFLAERCSGAGRQVAGTLTRLAR